MASDPSGAAPRAHPDVQPHPVTTPPDTVVETTDLTRHYGSVRAVDALNLSVERGSTFGFLGPNGAGKTTTLRLLLGIVAPTRGSGRVLDADIRAEGARVRARCGVLLEASGLYERLTAFQNLEFHRRAHRLPVADGRSRIGELLERFELSDWRDRPAGVLSRGMKQKLAVARAMLARPEVVFLDEPTSGLDPESSRTLRNHIGDLARDEGVTFFLTTHHLAEVETLCTHVGVMRGGVLLAAGDIDTIRRYGGEPAVEFVGEGFTVAAAVQLERRPEVVRVEAEVGRLKVTLVEGAPVGPLTAILVHAGVSVEAVRPFVPTLEAGYLALMNGAG